MQASFTVSVADSDGTVCLAFSGDLDLSARAVLIAHVDGLLRDDTVTDLVVDLSQVDFIDSSCIGALVAGKLDADKATKTFRVRGVHGQVAEVFAITGVGRVLTGPPPAPDNT